MSLDRQQRPSRDSTPDSPVSPSRNAVEGPDSADDACPVDRVIGVLHSLWATKIIWWLTQGPQRFGQLRRGLGSISAKVLTERLRRLEEQGVVARRVVDSVPPQMEYSLTDFGREFTPILEAMGQVAERISGASCPGRPALPVPKRSGVRART
jgi:DNA-binding HxlR family transcriptional regulator